MEFRIHSFLITIVVLASLSLTAVRASNPEIDGGLLKQSRLFNGVNFPIGNEPSTDDVIIEEADTRNNPGLRFLEEMLKSRQRGDFDDSSYALHYDATKELDPSLPYGIQNVMDGNSARIPRSKSHNKKIRSTTFQSLCPSKRETVFLNFDPDFEYRPDHYEEVLCANRPIPNENNIPTAVCSEAGFSCIQLNRTLFLTRRPRGDGCWESETRLVAAGCECMWPKHHLGDIMAHH